MKNWSLCLGLALALCGCGGDGVSGTWKGDLSGWAITAEVTQTTESAGTLYLSGTLSTNKPACFNNGTLSGTFVNNSSLSFISSASGSASSTTILKIDGEVSGETLTGYFESTSLSSECNVERTAIKLTRQ
ncbi:hypothetical protein [Melittangium boletus]|uniref:Lipoprotein n=1 Tax=Melittangium boletus DSM 14713 TaxID=1294270 RepID=A0A250IHW5_9BACT|nr:hypothetical protein [Melittangium boletus]ATB30751.1 hypothetical protein MEBOL_004213 [Melittangium boletus DSM 14713]